MTTFHKEYVSCPHCLNEEEVTVWDQIDAVSDPDLKDRLLRKQLQSFECRNCGRTHLISHPLLYRDDQDKLLIWCDQAAAEKSSETAPDLQDLLNKLPVPDDYRMRLTGQTNELIEKVHLSDNQLDDRIMEIVKLAVLAWQKEEIKVSLLYFLSAQADRLLFLAQAEDGNWYQLPVSAELYRQIEVMFSESLPPDTGWQKIDKEFAGEYFDQINQGK